MATSITIWRENIFQHCGSVDCGYSKVRCGLLLVSALCVYHILGVWPVHDMAFSISAGRQLE